MSVERQAPSNLSYKAIRSDTFSSKRSLNIPKSPHASGNESILRLPRLRPGSDVQSEKSRSQRGYRRRGLDLEENIEAIPIKQIQGSDGKPYYERERKSCFCIPLRIATIILSALSMIGTLTGVIIAFDQLLRTIGVSSGVMVGFTTLRVILWILLFALSFFGFSGACLRKRKWVELYAELLWWHVWIVVICGFFCLALLTSQMSKTFAIVSCMNDTRYEGLTWEDCSDQYRWILTIIDVSWALVVLIELWLLLIVCHYVDELFDEEELEKGIDIYGPMPYKLTMNPKGQQSELYERRILNSIRKPRSKRRQQERVSSDDQSVPAMESCSVSDLETGGDKRQSLRR